MATLAECFAHYGTIGKNPRWSWSARSDDGKVVAMTFWIDRFDYKSKPIRYLEDPEAGEKPWVANPGNRERLDNLIWARENLDGLLRVIFIKAVDVNAVTRAIENAHVNDRLLMRLVSLNETTGSFAAEAAK